MKTLLSLSFACAIATLPAAQWSKTSVTNLRLSDGAGDEVQSKIREGSDGFAFVSWFDSDPAGSPAFGFDVVLQRLDPSGHPQWQAGGVTLADRGFSSTQDYGMSAGPNSDAFVAFRDDRFSGTQITATRVDSAGVQLWGNTGVQLTNTTDFLAAPKIAALANGDSVVAWTQNGFVKIQRLDPAGATIFSEPVTVPVAPGETASLADLHASDAGRVILSYVSQSGGFFGPRHLKAVKLEADGSSTWGPPVDVYNAGSLQVGNFPSFSTDGSGGAIFAWYSTALQCFAQHLDANGAPIFAANGVAVSNNLVNQRVSPHASYRPSTAELFVFWTELAGAQSLRGMSGQKFDANGTPQWGSAGIAFEPVTSGATVDFVQSSLTDNTTSVAWIQSLGFGTNVVRVLNTDSAGNPLQAIATVASTPSSKSRLSLATGPFGDLHLAWQDDVNGDDDILVQNVRSDGTVGPVAGALARNAGTNPDSYTAVVGPLGGMLDLEIDLTGTGHQFGFFLIYTAPANVPFGTDVVLVDLFAPPGNLLKAGLKMGPNAQLLLSIPNDPTLCGAVLYTQGVHLDTVLPTRVTNAQDLYLGL